MTQTPWRLIPPDPKIERKSVDDLTSAELFSELDRIGNNWRDVNPRFSDIVQRVVREYLA